MNAPELLHSARLSLHKPSEDDASILFGSYVRDERVTRYLMWRPHRTIADSEGIIQHFLHGWSTGSEFCWFLFTRSDHELIGSIAARVKQHRVELGYVLARSFWGRGLMLEAISVVVQWAFTQPALFRVGALCDTENHASARVLEKAGFEREGILLRWAVHPNISDVPRDCYSYAKIRNI